MKTISLRPSDIEIGERHRALSEDAVDRLAASMQDIGLRQPITVRIVDMMVIDGQEVEGVPVLVAGRHRLDAAAKLGWAEIDCVEIEGDEIDAELWEIGENLHRLDLTKDQRDAQIRRYAELIEARREVDGLKGQQHQGGRPKTVATEIAEQTGISRKTVVRAIKRQSQRAIPADQLTDAEVIDRQVNAVMREWNKASPEARDIVRDQIDGPVFDSTRAA